MKLKPISRLSTRQSILNRPLCVIAVSILLTGCVNNVYQTQSVGNKYVEGFALSQVGATVGAFVTDSFSASMFHGVAGLGGMVYGSYQSSPYKLTQELRLRGVQVLHYGEKTTIILPSNGVFEEDSGEIRRTAYETLALIARYAKALPNSQIRIAGNTDNIGLMAQNLRLSREQAKSIRAYLWASGVAMPRLSAVGYGELLPIASNQLVSGRAANSRIEITFYKSPPESWGETPFQVPTTKWGFS